MDDQVLTIRRDIRLIAGEPNIVVIGEFKMELIVERDCLQEGVYFVVAVRSSAQYLQTPVDLRKGRKAEGGLVHFVADSSKLLAASNK